MSDITVLAVARIGGSGNRVLGTCFAVGQKTAATAHHVIAGDPTGLVLLVPQANHINDYQDTTAGNFQTVPVTVIADDPVRDLAILKLGDNAEFGGGHRLSSTDSTPVGSSVLTQGYPHANFGRVVLTQQEAKVGARVLIGSSGQTFKHLILNTQAREGQSGGPVFDEATGAVAAVLIGSYAPGGGGAISLGGVDPATLHQTTHAISAQYLRELL